MNFRSFLILITLTFAVAMLSTSACAEQPFLWASDNALGAVTDKSKIGEYLDVLKAHSVRGIWVPVEPGREGSVNYKKTTGSGLQTAEQFHADTWADDDFLTHVITEARRRDMKVIAKLRGANQQAWENNPEWRMMDSRGKGVARADKLGAFCPNSPYWEKVFFSMIEEIGAGYDIDGFFLDAFNAAYPTGDACFCAYCKARFEKETGKILPLRPVEISNWSNPDVKLHAVKRAEWLDQLWARYRDAVRRAKPDSEALLNLGGLSNSYKEGLSPRSAGLHVTRMVTAPFRITGLFDPEPEDEANLVDEQVLTHMTPYAYWQFLLKTMRGDGGGKPVVAVDLVPHGKRSRDVQIGLIESAVGAGANDYCFFGHFDQWLTGGRMTGAWGDARFVEYLKDLTTGDRSKWIADMRPDVRMAVLYDRDADFWTDDCEKNLRSVGGLFAFIQMHRKGSVDVLSSSESEQRSSTPTRRFNLDADALSRYDLVATAGLNYVCEEDLRALRRFVDNGGGLLILGGIGRQGKFLAEPLTDEAYEILGITTISDAETSGFLLQAAQHPAFMVPGGFSGPMGSFRLSPNKHDALSYEPKVGEGWVVIAHEVNDSGRRPAIVVWEHPESRMAYINSGDVWAFSRELTQILTNLLVTTGGRTTAVLPVFFSEPSSVNSFRSEDGLTRYIHIFTPKGESDRAHLRIRADRAGFPVSAEVVMTDGKARSLTVTREGREPKPMEMTVAPSGNIMLKLRELEPPFAMIRIHYEEQEQ